MAAGGAVMVADMAQLAGYGSGVLHVEEDNSLVTLDVYVVIRHPIYGGGLIGVVGFYVAFRSLFVLVAVTAMHVVIMHRLLFEERMLVDEFGASTGTT